MLAALAAMALTAAPVQPTQSPDQPSPASSASAVQPATDSRLSIDLCLSLTSDYYFRGIVQRPDTANLQAGAQVFWSLLATERAQVSLFAGSWSNFSADTAPAAAAGAREHWYEHDTYIGAAVTVDRFTLTTIYTWYNSPAADFTESEDVTLTLAYDDADHWGCENGFALNPSLSLAVENRNAASGPDSGVWLGLGVAPGFTLRDTAAGPLDIAFPVAAGLSINDYYQRGDGSSETLGFVSAGASATLDLGDRFGAVAPAVTLSITALSLHGVAEELNDGDSLELVFSATTAWSF